MYSNSRNDVPRVAQRYGTIAAHTRRRASVLVVFVVFCVHMHSFAGLIRRTPPPTFSDTAITDRHSDTTNSSSELTGCGYLVYWIGKIVRTCAPGGSRTPDFLRARRAPYPLGQALRSKIKNGLFKIIKMEESIGLKRVNIYMKGLLGLYHPCKKSQTLAWNLPTEQCLH